MPMRVALVSDFDPKRSRWACTPAHRVSARSATGVWVEKDLPHRPDDPEVWLVQCNSLSDLRTKLQLLPSETPIALSAEKTGLWIQADPLYVLKYAF
jgi:hypothetical protein